MSLFLVRFFIEENTYFFLSLKGKTMNLRNTKVAVAIFWAMILCVPLTAQAEAVGRFIEVEGVVDILRQGKLPALPAKVQEAVELSDVIRIKSASRAQIQFIDDSIITLAPGSRIAIDKYSYNADKKERQAVLQVFSGLVHTLVKKIHQVNQPDFILKTQTAVIGVRGTDWYTVLGINITDIYNASGTTEVSNIFPDVPGKVLLSGPMSSRVGFNLPPTVPMPIDPNELKMLRNQLNAKIAGNSDKSSSLHLALIRRRTIALQGQGFLRSGLGEDNPLTQPNLTIPPSPPVIVTSPTTTSTSISGGSRGSSGTVTGIGSFSTITIGP
jgi:hypothetical protein